MQSLQLAELGDSIRKDAIDSLTRVCDEYSLSYEFNEETMTIRLPKYEAAELPIVGRIEVPEEYK